MKTNYLGKMILSIFILLLASMEVKCQIFYKRDLQPEVHLKRGKYYNGSGGRGYWDLKTYDSKGRLLKETNYRNKNLLSVQEYQYDEFGNETSIIQTFDINHPNEIDTAFIKEYEYSDDQLIKETTVYGPEDYTVIQRGKNSTDSIKWYKETSYHRREKSDTSWSNVIEHEIKLNKKGKIKIWIKNDIQQNRKSITRYEYYSNGLIKSSKVERVPEYDLPIVYTGGPGGDVQKWKYKFNKKGDVKKLYKIIDGRKYKIAKYIYKYR